MKLTQKEQRIEAAAKAGRTIAFDYFQRTADAFADHWERRVIVPDPDQAVRENQQGRRYVIGHDLARDEARSFHTDQIDRISVEPTGGTP